MKKPEITWQMRCAIVCAMKILDQSQDATMTVRDDELTLAFGVMEMAKALGSKVS